MQFSSTRLEQGGVVCVRVSGVLDEGAALQLESDLPAPPRVDVPGGKAAFLGLHYSREPGDYAVTVRCGDFVQSAVVTVVHRDYPPPVSARVRACVGRSFAAVAGRHLSAAQYVRHTPGLEWPVHGASGVRRGKRALRLVCVRGRQPSPSRSSGVEYSCAASSPVTAPAAGTVVFAGSLELTGNTVVLDHGAGLKTYFSTCHS